MTDDLMHVGVKGMKWGRRKAVDSVSTSTRGSNIKRNLKIAGGITAGVAVAAGSIALVSTLNKKGSTPVSNLASHASTSTGKDWLDLSFGSSSTTSRPSSAGLNLGTPSRSSSSSSSSSSRPSTPRGPSLDVLSDIMNGGPHVTFNPQTGRYGTS